MAAHRIHAVVVPLDEPEGWGIVSDRELIAATDTGGAATAGELASRPGLYVTPVADLALVIGLLRQNALHHLIVVDQGSGRPVGIISTLDVAEVLAELYGFESSDPARSGGTEAHDRVHAAGLGAE
jgi:CBS domain-containing protein